MHPVRKLLGVVVLLIVSSPALMADDWPQWLGPKRDSVWRETGILDKFPADGPPILWRVSVGGGYAGPAVAKGRVYVTDRELSAGENNHADPFARRVIRGWDRGFCFYEAGGEVVW